MPDERILFLGHANGSALECAACLDVLVARALLTVHDVWAGKQELQEIVKMLISMKETTSARVREEATEYHAGTEPLFSHERLDVYQVALGFIKWQEGVSGQLRCSADLRAKMDKSSTGIVLNIAEGNGRFSSADHAKFLGIAYKATVQSAALLESCTVDHDFAATQLSEGLAMPRRIAAMLTGLLQAVSDHT
jgi:four helix bundle protein